MAPDSSPVDLWLPLVCLPLELPDHPVPPPVLQVVTPAPDGGEEGGVLVRHVPVASHLGHEGLAGAPVLHSSRTDRHPHPALLSPAETEGLREGQLWSARSPLLTTSGTNE